MTLPLFPDAWRLVEGSVSEVMPEDKDSVGQEGNDLSDFFGEIEITARLMITGGPARAGRRHHSVVPGNICP